jgi:hypothetical protein
MIARARVRAAAPVLAILLAGCSPKPPVASPSQPPPAGAPTDAPAPTGPAPAALGELEGRLLRDDATLDFTVGAEGAIAVGLEGRLRFAGATIELDAVGGFGGEVCSLSLRADGKTAKVTAGGKTAETPQPPELREAIVVGLVRMGLLHNLARLRARALPDHAEGGSDAWVRARDGSTMQAEILGDTDAGDLRTAFAIVVDGSDSGEVVAWIDRESGLPRERVVLVRFPEGEMHVRERYSDGSSDETSPVHERSVMGAIADQKNLPRLVERFEQLACLRAHLVHEGDAMLASGKHAWERWKPTSEALTDAINAWQDQHLSLVGGSRLGDRFFEAVEILAQTDRAYIDGDAEKARESDRYWRALEHRVRTYVVSLGGRAPVVDRGRCKLGGAAR